MIRNKLGQFQDIIRDISVFIKSNKKHKNTLTKEQISKKQMDFDKEYVERSEKIKVR